MRIKENKVYTLWHFTVRGRHDFPSDMLRYDRCWPKTEYDSAKLTPNNRGQHQEWREIELVSLRPPTEGRWYSFGWQVTESNPQRVG